MKVAEKFARRCADRDVRADVAGTERGSLAARIRSARLVPYHAVIGAREAVDGAVAFRLRDGRRLDPLAAEEALDRIAARVETRSTVLWESSA